MFLDTTMLVWGLLCWGLFAALSGAPRPVLSDAQRARAQAKWERRVEQGRRRQDRRDKAIRARRRERALAMYHTHVKRLPWRQRAGVSSRARMPAPTPAETAGSCLR